MAQRNFKNTKVYVDFDEASSRQQLNSGDNISTLFGKIKKIFSDLKSVCFTGSYKDLSDTPTTATKDTDGLMSADDKTKLDSADDTYALKSLYGDTTINVGRKAGTKIGYHSTAEGVDTTASGLYTHSEGHETVASGDYGSHSEGEFTNAAGGCSHAEGLRSEAIGDLSHAEGSSTKANGRASHTEGDSTIANNEAESACGKYNVSNPDTLFSIGDGTSYSARHNAFEITTTGGKLHDKDIAVKDDIINPNLLINPDFAINQRGNTSNTITSSTWANFFIADRWTLYINNAAPEGTIQRNDDGTITLAMTTAYCDIRQVFESTIKEGYYTLSAKINGEVRTLSGYKNNTGELIDNKGLVLGNRFFGVRCYPGKTITVEWVKLEQGTTPTNFVPPNIADEMTKCLRYYEKIEYPTSSGLTAIQWQKDLNNCSANIPFFTKRINSPTVTLSGGSGWRFVSNNGVTTITSGTVQSVTSNNVGASFALASATTTPSFGWVDRFTVTVEAEL